jgi:hypothetical protein
LAAEQIGAQTAVQQPVQPVPVLHRQRLVEAEIVPQLVVLLGGVGGGLPGQHGLRRVAGGKRTEQESQHRHGEQQHD